MRWRMPTIRECTDAYCVRADRPAGMHARATDLLPIERPHDCGAHAHDLYGLSHSSQGLQNGPGFSINRLVYQNYRDTVSVNHRIFFQNSCQIQKKMEKFVINENC